MSRVFARHAGRHTRVLGCTGWGGLARYCADASRRPVVERSEDVTRPRSVNVRIEFCERTAA